MGSKNREKKIMKKNQQTSLLFFHIKNNKNTSDRIEKPCLLYKRKKKTGPHSILHSLKKENYSSQSKKKLVRISFFFLFPIYLQTIKKIWFQTKFFPSIL